MVRLADLATQVRSKNAGPTALTLDLFFDDRESYERAKDSDALTLDSIASLYDVPRENVLGIYELDRIQAIKVSIARPVTAGDVGDVDVYGTQQHVPFLELDV